MRIALIAAVVALTAALAVGAASPAPTSQRLPAGPIPADCTGEVADMSSFAGRASSIHVTEVFRIENNLIRRVGMTGTGIPYHFNSSWGRC